MKTLKERLLKYWEAISGVRPDLSPSETSALPLFLRERYEIFSARLLGRIFPLAIEVEGWESGSPGEYGKHSALMQNKLGVSVVLVLPNLPSYARNRMVQMGIPFIVPGSQTFLPTGLIDLREHFPQPRAKGRQALSPAAQCVLIYHLLREPLDGMALKEISPRVRYSKMMITKVKDELEVAEICRTTRLGRSTVMEFTAKGHSLWGLIEPRLVSPVRKTHWVTWQNSSPPALLAGISALSRRTMIVDDRLPTYALSRSQFHDFLEKGVCVGCPDSEHATASLEVWSYDPMLLGDNAVVDPLSLYLSLRHSGDERVQQQLAKLIDGIKW